MPRLLALARWPQGDATQGRTPWASPLPWLYERGFVGIADDPIALLGRSCETLGYIGLRLGDDLVG